MRAGPDDSHHAVPAIYAVSMACAEEVDLGRYQNVASTDELDERVTAVHHRRQSNPSKDDLPPQSGHLNLSLKPNPERTCQRSEMTADLACPDATDDLLSEHQNFGFHRCS